MQNNQFFHNVDAALAELASLHDILERIRAEAHAVEERLNLIESEMKADGSDEEATLAEPNTG